MMISKEMFRKVIEAIQKDRDENEKLTTALDKYLLNGHAVVKSSASYEMLLDLIKELFNDKEQYSMLEWWLYDNVDKYIYDEHHNVIADLTTVDALYDYLVESMDDTNASV